MVPDMWPLVSAIQVLLLERRLRGPAPLPIASRRGFKPRVPTTLVSWTVTTKRSQMKGRRARSKFRHVLLRHRSVGSREGRVFTRCRTCNSDVDVRTELVPQPILTRRTHATYYAGTRLCSRELSQE